METSGYQHSGHIGQRLIDADWQLHEQVKKSCGLGFCDATPPFGDQQHIGDFELPERPNERFLVLQPIEHSIGQRSRLVVEAPCRLIQARS